MTEGRDWSRMRESIIGLGTDSSRRTYYPELLARVAQLEEARTSLRRSEENLRTLFDSLHDAIILHDWEGRVLEANQAMLVMYGVTRETFRDHTIADYSADAGPASPISRHLNELRDRILNDEPQVFEWRARRPLQPGCDFDVEVSLRKVRWYDQELMVSVVRDISERKRLEAMLNQSQKLDSLGQLAGGVAHDTNNMLGVIIGYADLLLERTGEQPGLRRDIEQIRKAALHSADLNRQLLAFARKQTIQPTAVDLNTLVEATQKLLRRLIGEQHALVWKPATALWRVWADPSQLDQVLTNLVVNARDAIEPAGTITLETANVTLDEAAAQFLPDAELGEYAVLRVTDTGHGIPPEILTRIFEPFFTTKALGRGTGLGLAMVYGIVRQNRGFLTVTSTEGTGSTFSIHLPRHRGVERAEATSPDAELRGGPETILLVEDEEALLETGYRILEGAGYQVVATADPLEALRLVEAGLSPDLLATDLVMPGLDGQQVYQHLRHLRPGLRVLFLSGYAAGTLDHESLAASGSGFLQKPFSRAALLQKVRALLDS